MPPPRLRLQPRQLRKAIQASSRAPSRQCRCASAATAAAITPAPSIEALTTSVPPILRFPSTQPPSHKRPEFRKSQLHRQYTSLLHSSPLILIFQHNNLTSPEWTSIRRELARALRKVDEELAPGDALADGIKINIIHTGIFHAALRIVEFYDPDATLQPAIVQPSDPATNTSKPLRNQSMSSTHPGHTHALSTAAYKAARRDPEREHGLEPLMSGPLALVPFPVLSPAHLAAVLRIIAPNPQFSAPKRRANPTYHEPAVQAGLQKLMLLGARVEGKVFDDAGVRWVGGIAGGLDGLRSQLVGLLTAAGASITQTLQAASTSVYFTMEGRKQQLEDEAKPEEAGAGDLTKS